MPAIDFAQVRNQVSMEQVLALLNFVPSRRRGSRLRGPCPIHRSADPQSRCFWVDLSTHRYRCFGCRRAGRQIDLWAAVHGKAPYAAADDLCHRLGLPIPWLPTANLRRASQ
ncbi:MAG: CHC2 zinc finger domain-containing protein [Thermoguttaceae bacterium]